MTTKFVLTIGLFDKDTKKLELDPANAQALLNNEVARRFNGATVYSADGVYRHNNGETVREPSLRVELCYTTREDAVGLAKWAKAAFNQESVMLEAIEEECDFI